MRRRRKRRTPMERRRAFHLARIAAAGSATQAMHAAYQYLQATLAWLSDEDEPARDHRADLLTQRLITEAEEVQRHGRR